jgi:transposase
MAAAKKKAKVMTKAERLVRERAIIVDLRAGEMSYRSIAMKHGVSLPTVNAKARKAKIRRRPGARVMAKGKRTKLVAKPTRVVRKKKRQVKVRGKAVHARRATWAMKRSTERFHEQFMALIMNYYPNISLARFERLARQIQRFIG